MAAPRDSLLLWDIDGTLISSGRAGERSLLFMIRDVYGHDFGDKLPVSLQGRTDTSIARDLLTHMKVESTPEEEGRFREAYLKMLPATLAEGHSRLLPGVREALDAVHAHPEIHQGLLTGNHEAGARLKLGHHDVWRYFEFGAYAGDSHNRNELGPFALARAKEKLGITFPPERVFIIGDTPHDIACGKAIGAKTIAVATGGFTFEQLAALEPTHTFHDLSDTQALIKVIL
jgi:phosphoglycolate phosphatase